MSRTIVMISDTHGHNDVVLPDGDILIHAGDMTGRGQMDELAAFADWMGALPHKTRIVVAGNHDFCFERQPEESRAMLAAAGCTYLEDESVEVDGIRFYGSPWQPWFCNWAFNVQRGPDIRKKWDLIPNETDVLITHGPPFRILDANSSGAPVGCEELLDAVQRVTPRLHVFGHIHESYGTVTQGATTFVNASTCTIRYLPVNAPVVFEFEGT